MLSRLQPGDTGDVLELGCGPGHFWRDTRDMRPAGWRVICTDLSPGAEPLVDYILSMWGYREALLGREQAFADFLRWFHGMAMPSRTNAKRRTTAAARIAIQSS
jgi:SAM-dependent methyltransferase